MRLAVPSTKHCTRYDRAKSEGAIRKVREDTPPVVDDLRRRVTEIDHWGVKSPL